MVSAEEWIGIRRGLRFGQRFRGTVTAVPRPGAIGIFVDIGLPVGGFVDVLLLPTVAERWPGKGTEAEFEVWWADQRPQVRLKPADPQFLRDDFAQWQANCRPGWPENTPVDQAWVDASATSLRATGVMEETLRAADSWPTRRIPTARWRVMTVALRPAAPPLKPGWHWQQRMAVHSASDMPDGYRRARSG